MNRLIHVFILAGVLLLASCSREPSPANGGNATVHLSAVTGETRADAAATAEEKEIKHVDWFVSDAAGAIMDTFRGTTPSETFTLSKGNYSFMALANLPTEAPAVGDLSLDDYKASIEVSFKECFAGAAWNGFAMRSNPVAVELTQDKNVTIDMVRIASKVVLEGGVTFDISPASSLAPLPKEIKSVFLTNIPEKVNAYTGDMVGTEYVNDASSESFVPSCLSADGIPTALMPEKTWSLGAGQAVLYGHPNKAVQSGDVYTQDMTTKLVVCGKIGDEIMYWPVSIPGLGSNNIVTISGITITGRGSSGPNDYLQDNSAVRFRATLEPWEWWYPEGEDDEGLVLIFGNAE